MIQRLRQQPEAAAACVCLQTSLPVSSTTMILASEQEHLPHIAIFIALVQIAGELR
jgi:hypothetical protein